MAAALFRGRLCLRCIHSELCRVVWRPQAAQFSSKPSDRKQPRRTHIKKAKPQPAVDIATLLEHLFSQRRPGTAPPPGKVRPTKVSSVSTKPPTTSSVGVPTSNVPPLLKTEPAASNLKQVHSVHKKKTPTFNTNIETATEPVELKTASVLPLSEKNIETSSFSAASAAEPLIETTTESPVEPSLFPVEALKASAAVAEGPAGPVCQEAARANTLEDLDPVQRLFLEKIREYNNLRRLNQGLMEAEPDYVKTMSEETTKLQRLYGGGDLSSFPEFTFTEPEMDQDS
uniref:uncharacterized protein LOC124065971 isoform X1 n=1 Tax=Scatophagus argus TaxID=75038 RepID=UPI001ED7CD51|nr:uncharacterized protein LOC124065971 isoform X1 [Scatophagus argus]